jgi:DNA-binding winged helix-turn-helix (wHTH) protein
MSEHTTDLRPDRRYRFGAFEADAGTKELRKQGVRIKLNAQPFQVLLLLMDRPGQLLTREEISRELWPDGTFVDYEHGVNSAVNRIREALGDTANNPRFVETLARRGYRFVAPVERIIRSDDSPTTAANDNPSTGEAAVTSEQMELPAEQAALPSLPTEAPTEPEPKLLSRILASPQELPKASYPVVQTLFVLLQLMYLSFYVGALANLAEIEGLLSPLPRSAQVFLVLIVTAAVLIPVRAFVLSAALFHAPGVRGKFLRMWPFLLALDELWSLAPFLLMHHINFGLALACTTLLVYSPFAQRSLILMGAGGIDSKSPATAR